MDTLLQPLRLPGHKSSCGNSFYSDNWPMNEPTIQRSSLILCAGAKRLSFISVRRVQMARALWVTRVLGRYRYPLGQLQIGVWVGVGVGVGVVRIDTIWLLVKTVTVRSLFIAVCSLCRCPEPEFAVRCDDHYILLPVPASAECGSFIARFRESCALPHTRMIMILNCGSFA